MKVAIVHDWLITPAGSERVLEQIVSLYPDADLYCLVDFLPEGERGLILNKTVRTSFIQNLPFAKKHYRNYLPFFPLAVERFDLSGCDLILSSSHAVAKGAVRKSGQLHICYCHTPMRYAWDLRDQYLEESGLDKGLKGMLAKTMLGYLRRWDAKTAGRVDHFVANSHYIAARIKNAYNRQSYVIYPPVDVERFALATQKEEFYLVASRMVPYKKIDLIVEAFSGLPNRRLVVIGDGPDFEKIKSKSGKNIELLGYQTSDVLKTYMQKAKAFVFAAEEDFGIVPVEAQACGTPVIAYGRGGIIETVLPLVGDDIRPSIAQDPAPTGVFFREQTVEALRDALKTFERNVDKFDGQRIRKNAIRFGTERFKQEFKAFVDAKTGERL